MLTLLCCLFSSFWESSPGRRLHYPRRCWPSRRSCLLYSSPPVFTSFHNSRLLLLRCPDGYFGRRCLQTEPRRLYMPSPFKSMFAHREQQRTENQSGTGGSTSADLRCSLRPPHLLLLFSPPLSPPQVVTQWAVHYTTHMVASSMELLCFCCLYLFPWF